MSLQCRSKYLLAPAFACIGELNQLLFYERQVHKANLLKLKLKGPLEFDFKTDVTEGRYPEHEHESITPRSVRVVLLLSSALIVGSFLHILCFT